MVTNGASEMMNVRKFDATNNYLFDFTRGAIVKTRFNVSRKKYGKQHRIESMRCCLFDYFTCLLTTLASSNMEIWSLPKMGFSFPSALIILRLFLSCRLFFLI